MIKTAIILFVLFLFFRLGCWLADKSKERRKGERRSWSRQYRKGTLERRVSGDRRLPQVEIEV